MDQQGNYRTIELKSMKYNLVLDDKIFEFIVTDDMEVIETDN
jgi:outer membrane lipoprotein-sorting protein